MAANAQDRLTQGGTLDIAQGYTFDPNQFPALDGTNYDTVAAQIESTYSFEQVLGFQNLAITHTPTNEQILELDDCGIGTASRTITPQPNLSFDYFNVDDIDRFAQFLGLTVQTITGTPVAGEVQVQVSGNWSFAVPFELGFANGDGTAVTVNSVTASVDGALVLNTDYTVGVNSAGQTIITIIDSVTVTTEAQDITVNYDYTPADTKYVGYDIESRDVPFNLLRFTTCPNAAGEINIYYMAKYSLTSDYAMTFANLDRDGISETPASLTLTGDKGGLWIECKQTLTVL